AGSRTYRSRARRWAFHPSPTAGLHCGCVWYGSNTNTRRFHPGSTAGPRWGCWVWDRLAWEEAQSRCSFLGLGFVRQDRAMRLLILGGGWFLGRALIEQALERDHNVVTFTRGKSGGDAPGAALHRGDRAKDRDMADLAAMGPWDVVIDTSGMTPDMVERSSRALVEEVDRYLYVSTVNVYQGWPTQPLDDSSAVRPYLPSRPSGEPGAAQHGPPKPLDDSSAVRSYLPYGPSGESGADQYGREKVGCEQAVTSVFGDRATLLRPGVIIGPHEYVGRIPWWLRRIAGGGRVLAPGTPDWSIQPIDVRDVAAFALDVVEQQLTGSFNLTAPIGSATFGGLLDACRQATGGPAELEWVDHDFLISQGVREWTELPLWRPYPGTWKVDSPRARAAGLTCRPLTDTVIDTWEWLSKAGPQPVHERAAELGISPEREAAVLAAWASRRGR